MTPEDVLKQLAEEERLLPAKRAVIEALAPLDAAARARVLAAAAILTGVVEPGVVLRALAR